MPEKVTIETDGFATSSCGQVSVVVDQRRVRFPEQFVYDHDIDYRRITIPRWLAEEKDVEHRAREGDARPPRRS